MLPTNLLHWLDNACDNFQIVKWDPSFNVFFELVYSLLENAEVRATSIILNNQVKTSHIKSSMTDALSLSKLFILIEKITSIENVKKYYHAMFSLDLGQIVKKT